MHPAKTTHGLFRKNKKEIAEKFYELVGKDYKHFIINFEKTRIVNSGGLSLITDVVVKVYEFSGSIAFVNMTSLIKQTFAIVGLTKYSKLYDTQEEAVAQLKNELK